MTTESLAKTRSLLLPALRERENLRGADLTEAQEREIIARCHDTLLVEGHSAMVQEFNRLLPKEGE